MSEVTYFGGYPQSGSVAEYPTMIAPTFSPAVAAVGVPIGASYAPQPGGSVPASEEVLRQQAAAALQRCYRWLEVAVPVIPQLAGLVPAVVTAVQQYEARQYAASLHQVFAVVTVVRQVQATVPILPVL
jgi:hypothetical protein